MNRYRYLFEAACTRQNSLQSLGQRGSCLLKMAASQIRDLIENSFYFTKFLTIKFFSNMEVQVIAGTFIF